MKVTEQLKSPGDIAVGAPWGLEDLAGRPVVGKVTEVDYYEDEDRMRWASVTAEYEDGAEPSAPKCNLTGVTVRSFIEGLPPVSVPRGGIKYHPAPQTIEFSIKKADPELVEYVFGRQAIDRDAAQQLATALLSAAEKFNRLGTALGVISD